ncbi:unnamed protein product [Mesocestoides corti]|uniref:Bestrophin homolog n=1 Tax=Mesocestoides corti TaxID=53468 RepID=A0A0R3UM83_MESCO|nr:unnamed protein product [Mesocestoides corti]
MYIPWLNNITYQITSAINCADARAALRIRLSLARYLNLSWILMMRTISDRISNRFKQYRGSSPRQQRQRLRHDRNDTVRCTELLPEQTTRHDQRKQKFSPLLTKPISSLPQKSSSRGSGIFNFNIVDSIFDAPDEYGMRETLRSFNGDKKVQATFGKIITEEEIRAFESIARNYFSKKRQRYLPEYWVPIQWAVRLVQKAAIHGNIPDSKIMIGVFQEIGGFRKQLQKLKTFCSLTMPLVYTQVAVIAVYSYFLCQILATQHIERAVNGTSTNTGLPVPIFSIFYFIFVVGWLKVALCVMNPFGEDYEDFETSDMFDYNLDVSYRAVLMDEATYPEELKRATFQTRTMEGAENDNLKIFLDKVSRDMDDVEFDEDANDIHNLEFRPGICSQIREKFCKKREKADRFGGEEKLQPSIPNPLTY